MFGLNTLRAAIARLAGSLNSLADTADEIRVNVRQQLALDAPPVEIAALPSPKPTEASGVAQDEPADATANGTPSARNGRRRATAQAE